MKAPVQLIVGLGNPGPEYANSRHNAGQDFVEALARAHGQQIAASPKYFGLVGRINVAGKDIRLLVPTTYMNRSGQAVSALAHFFKIPPEAVLVAHDELDIDPGISKLKFGGGHGGHNGLRDIINSLGNNNNFARLRIGIGHPGNAKLVSNYVLKKAPPTEFNLIDDAIRYAQASVEDLVKGDWEKAMRELHSR